MVSYRITIHQTTVLISVSYEPPYVKKYSKTSFSSSPICMYITLVLLFTVSVHYPHHWRVRSALWPSVEYSSGKLQNHLIFFMSLFLIGFI